MSNEEVYAHQVADAYRTLAELLPKLSLEIQQTLAPSLESLNAAVQAYRRRAETIELRVPFQPVSEGKKSILLEGFVDGVRDFSGREIAEQFGPQSEWEFRAEADDWRELLEDAGDIAEWDEA